MTKQPNAQKMREALETITAYASDLRLFLRTSLRMLAEKDPVVVDTPWFAGAAVIAEVPSVKCRCGHTTHCHGAVIYEGEQGEGPVPVPQGAGVCGYHSEDGSSCGCEEFAIEQQEQLGPHYHGRSICDGAHCTGHDGLVDMGGLPLPERAAPSVEQQEQEASSTDDGWDLDHPERTKGQALAKRKEG
jgi:hypothetical protein